ncbi:MAG: type II toxin-antitoxin system VapC family toxin [Pseudomonadota bacterium]
MIILDTNVISELQKPAPNDNVISWLDAQEPTNLYLTAVTAAELTFGVENLPDGQRATRLKAAIAQILDVEFRGRILAFDTKAARIYGQRMAECRRAGLGVGVSDGQIGAIALANNSPQIASRDTAPFQAFRLDTINPFEVC